MPGIPRNFIKIIFLILRMLKNFLSPPPIFKVCRFSTKNFCYNGNPLAIVGNNLGISVKIITFVSTIIYFLMMTRITREWALAVWALGFVLILRDLIRGIKDGQSTLTKTDSSRTSRFHHDIIHKYDVTFTQWRLTSSTKSSHIIPQGPHHHLELFKRSPVGFLLKSTGNQPRSWVQD